MKSFSKIIFSLMLLLFIGCGGGGGSSTNPSVTPVTNETLSGKAVDGYLNKATVFLDLNNNKILDSNEPSTTTDYSGDYTLTYSNDLNTSNAVLIVTGGYDIDTDEEFQGIMQASLVNKDENNKIHISPMSTLLQEGINNGDTLEEAKTKVAQILNINKNDLNKDPVSEFSNNPNLYKVNRQLIELADNINKHSDFSNINEKDFMITFFNNLHENNQSIDDLSNITIEGSIYNFDDVRKSVVIKINNQEPEDPNSKYTNIKVENLRKILDNPGDVNVTDDIGLFTGDIISSYTSTFAYRNNVNTDILKVFPVVLTNIDNGDEVFYTENENNTTTKYLFKNSTTIQKITDSNETFFNTISWIAGEYIMSVNSAIDYDENTLLLGVTSSNSSEYMSRTAIFNKNDLSITPLKFEDDTYSDVMPIFILEDKLITKKYNYNSYDIPSTLATYTLTNDNGLKLKKTFTEFAQNIQVYKTKNIIIVSDYDGDGKLEVIMTTSGQNRKYYCAIENTEFTECLSYLVDKFVFISDTQLFTIEWSPSGTYRNIFAKKYEVKDGKSTETISKKIVSGNRVLASAGSFSYNHESKTLKVNLHQPSETEVISNLNVDTFVEDKESLPNDDSQSNASSCSTSYPGDLKNEPQLVGQCQLAYFYACNKKVYASQYPEKVATFDFNIKTYCDILDGYGEFTKGTNPKKLCSACDGF